MQAATELNGIERKVHGDANQDGLMDLVMGVVFLGFAGRALHPALVGMFALGAILFRPVLLALRRRYTYPRIGYVKLVEDKPGEVLGGIAAVTLILIAVLVLALAIFGDLRSFDLWLKWSPVFPGTLLAGMFSAMASKSALVRYHVFAAASAMSGVVCSIPPFDPPETGLFVYFLLMGILLTLWGLVVFIRFLRRHPKPAGEVSDVDAR